MRIAFLTMYFPPKWVAGIELVTYNLASELAKRGHEVHVITTLDDGLPRESTMNGFIVHRIPYGKGVPLISLGNFFLKVRGEVRKISPDVLHIQNILWGWMGAFIRGSYSIPYVVNAHGDDIYQDHRFKVPAIRYGVRRAGAVVALTEAMKKSIESLCDVEVCIVPNGVYTERFEGAFMTREQLGMPQDSKLVTFAGGLRPVKGVRYLIEAMPLILERHGEAHCLIIGDGPERPPLEVLVKDLRLEDKVSFWGRAENDKIPEMLSSSDVFVLPSLSEGFPLVVLEAMAAGLPLVCSRVGGTPDVVVEGRNGYLVEPRNPQQIAERVLLLLDSDLIREQMGRMNKADAKNFSWNQVAEKFERIYGDLNMGDANKEDGSVKAYVGMRH